jgi:pimeloyl-ACP methyl ester carboxylesterase
MLEKWCEYNNSKVYYKTMGSGEPVMLIHGFAEDHRVWQNQLSVLANDNFLIVPDLPGSGNSELIADMSMEGMAACLKHLAEYELGTSAIQKGIVLFGHSMGGYITLAIEELYPQLVKAFALVHSTAYADTGEKKKARLKSIEFIHNHGSYEFLKQSIPNLFHESYRIINYNWMREWIDSYKHLTANTLIQYYQAIMQRPERISILKETSKPVLFLLGRHDVAVSFEHSLKQCYLPQISYIHILDKSSHMGMWEQVTKTNESLNSFLEDIYLSYR